MEIGLQAARLIQYQIMESQKLLPLCKGIIKKHRRLYSIMQLFGSVVILPALPLFLFALV